MARRNSTLRKSNHDTDYLLRGRSAAPVEPIDLATASDDGHVRELSSASGDFYVQRKERGKVNSIVNDAQPPGMTLPSNKFHLLKSEVNLVKSN